MARNQEKQQGKLNRLWLQKEREEGRLKDVHERRPKLSTLNSASSVKKWIPSIKKEIEYYLQQSQLSHYPERKIAEFQLHMEALEREYKRFITKLRALDPACKHKPWTPRAYCKRSAGPREPPGTGMQPRPCESHDGSSQISSGQSDSASSRTGSLEPPAPERAVPLWFQTLVPTNPDSGSSEAACADQDQPLSFDHARLAVATAAFRGPPPPPQRDSSHTRSLAQVLQSGLPNLGNTSSIGRTFLTRSDGAAMASAQKGVGQHPQSNTGTTGHVLGLDCYSSSDEERDA